jgi:hypothetical protein
MGTLLEQKRPIGVSISHTARLQLACVSHSKRFFNLHCTAEFCAGGDPPTDMDSRQQMHASHSHMVQHKCTRHEFQNKLKNI